jgi:hypothetical protein
MAPASNSAASTKEREEEQPAESKSDDSEHKLIKANLEELTTQSIKRSLQALVQPLFSGLGIQTTFLRALLSFGRFSLQSGNLVVQSRDLGLQARILSGKIVQLGLQGSLVGGSLSPNP